MIIVAVYDIQTDAVLPQVFTTDNEATAKRMFIHAPLERVGLGIIAQNPGDFWLVKIADFDQGKTGTVSPDNKRLFCFEEVINNV